MARTLRALALLLCVGLAAAATASPSTLTSSSLPPPPPPLGFQTLSSPPAGPESAASPSESASATDSLVVAPATEYSRLKYTGTATTAYSKKAISNFGAASYGCGLGYVNDNFTSNYIGIGSGFYNSGYSCGQCVRLQCDDDTCEQPGKQLVAEIIDTCGNCEDADISISVAAFTDLTGRPDISSPTALISWEFVDCSPYINGTIKMLVKSGGTIYYQAFNFANSRYAITAAEINGDRLTHGADNFWSWNPGSPINTAGVFNIAILASTGEVLTINNIPGLRSTDLGVQFAAVEATPSPAT